MDKRGWDLERFVLGLRYRVITLDNRGAGRSDKPAGGYDLARMADDAIAVLDHAEVERAHVVGGVDRVARSARSFADQAPRPDPLRFTLVLLGVPQPAVADPAPARVGRGRETKGLGRMTKEAAAG